MESWALPGLICPAALFGVTSLGWTPRELAHLLFLAGVVLILLALLTGGPRPRPCA